MISHKISFKQVSMMSEAGDELPGNGISHNIKKEDFDGTFQECSPTNSDMYSPTTTVMHDTPSVIITNFI